MGKILIIDDNREFAEEISEVLKRDGHSIELAFSATKAIEVGCSFRPDVIVTDWMLKGEFDGLSVSECIQVVKPSIQTILITAFASLDLFADARRLEVFEFIEKPFSIEQIKDATSRAALFARSKRKTGHIGFFEVKKDGTISFTNEAAESILDFVMDGIIPTNLDEIFSAKELDRLRSSLENWVEIYPKNKKRIALRGSSRENGDFHFIMLDDNSRFYRYSLVVNRLLGIRNHEHPTLSVDGHILVVDDNEGIRRSTVDVLRMLNCVCHAAQNYEEAIRLIFRDSDIEHVIIDFEMEDMKPQDLLTELRRIRPELNFIGTSGLHHREDFADLGVKQFLPKPWNFEDFARLLKKNTSQLNS
jgi:DNA-binding NtrC family response regulator